MKKVYSNSIKMKYWENSVYSIYLKMFCDISDTFGSIKGKMNLAWWANESFLNVSWIKYERIERQMQSILHIPRCQKISEKVFDKCSRILYLIKAVSQRQAQNRKVWFGTAWFFKKELEKSSWQTLLVLIY